MRRHSPIFIQTIDVKKRMALVLMANCAVDLNGEGAELMGWLERN
jgi:hypothetical protein